MARGIGLMRVVVLNHRIEVKELRSRRSNPDRDNPSLVKEWISCDIKPVEKLLSRSPVLVLIRNWVPGSNV